MLKTLRIRNFAFGAAVAIGVLTFADALSPIVPEMGKSAVAQDQNGGRRGRGGDNNNGERRNWNGGQGGQGGNRGPGGFNGGQGGNRGPGGFNGGQGGNRGPGGFNRGGGPGGFSPEQIVANMTQERFERLRSTPFADRVKEMVGNDRWAQWERGDFTASVSAAEQAAAAAEGRPLETEMTEEEQQQAEAQLRRGTVPKFSEGKAYSLESENEYMQEALARRDDTLVPTVPVAIRFYARYLMDKYDKNGNGQLEQEEWDGKIQGAQAIDLDRDWILTDQEILFYLARFGKGRTIANPRPLVPPRTNLVVEKQEQPVLIRTASAAPRVVSKDEAEKERTNVDGQLDQLTDEEFMAMMTEDNPAMESVDNEELLDVLLSDMDESSVREYAAAPQDLIGVPVWFLARDANGDGQLSLREFTPNMTPAALAQFGKLDLNADGLITAEEIKQATGNK